MEQLSAKQVLSNLYALMMEINLNRTTGDALTFLEENPDQQISNHLRRIKQLNAKLKAQSTQNRFQNAIEQINFLKNKGIEHIRSLIQPEEQTEYVALFRKFEELNSEDEASILQDQEVLYLIEKLKDRLDEDGIKQSN